MEVANNDDDDDVDVGDVTTQEPAASRDSQVETESEDFKESERVWGRLRERKVFFSYVRGTTHDVRPGTDSMKRRDLVSSNNYGSVKSAFGHFN